MPAFSRNLSIHPLSRNVHSIDGASASDHGPPSALQAALPEDYIRRTHAYSRVELTSSSYQHVHVLRRARDGRSDSKDQNEGNEDRLASKRIDEVAYERKDGRRSDGVCASCPDEIGAMELADNSGQGGGDCGLKEAYHLVSRWMR